jgi:two-component system sensor histidine kinase DegS
LRDYLAKYRTYYGLEVDLLLDDMTPPEFDLDVGRQILRIIQEALINVRKHAKVNRALIRFAREKNDVICISIEDRGQGFELEKAMSENGSSFGLQIMHERVKSIGGHLEIQSAPNVGSRLMVWVPVEPGS